MFSVLANYVNEGDLRKVSSVNDSQYTIFSDVNYVYSHVVASYKIRDLSCINHFTQWYIDLASDLARLSNIQYSPLKKQSENLTTATTRKRNWISILKLQANIHPF